MLGILRSGRDARSQNAGPTHVIFVKKSRPVMTWVQILFPCVLELPKATLARGNLYFSYALEAARAGRIEVAREVALETVGHVDLEQKLDQVVQSGSPGFEDAA
jgi:hypothetical protein